jgi:poly(A) polymerase
MEGAGVLGRVLPGAAVGRVADLVAVEARAGVAPDWKRRLRGARRPARRGRGAPAPLAGRDARARGHRRRAGRGGPVPSTAYRHGAEAARDAALLRAAADGAAPPRALAKEIARGASATFPVSADDLMARGMKPGRALGERLAALEAEWLASDFTMNRGALLDR